VGSKSSSATSSTTTNKETNLSQADYSTGDGSRTNANVTGDKNTVTIQTTDFGAVQGSFDVAKDSVGKALSFGTEALDFAQQQGQGAMDAVSKAVIATQSLAASAEKNQSDTVDKLTNLVSDVKTEGQSTAMKMLAAVVALLMLSGVAVAYFMRDSK
jgi:hypothetical protein